MAAPSEQGFFDHSSTAAAWRAASAVMSRRTFVGTRHSLEPLSGP
jgi:hypothetical protein